MKRYAIAALAVGSIFAGCGYRPESPLEEAAYQGRVAELERLIADGADLKATNSRGLSALTAAARGGKVAALQVLVAHGAPLDNPEGINRWTPLMHAVHKGQLASIEYLLSAGADARAQNSHALFLAAGYGDVEATLRLLDAGADPAAVSSEGSNALAAAVGGTWDIDASWRG
jgi:ankyrin repeat protein